MKTKIIYLNQNPEIEKNNKELLGEENDNKKRFDNEQMKLHFYDILEEIELKFAKEKNLQEELKIIFLDIELTIDSKFLVFAFAYEELENKYKLEALTLIEEIHSRFGEGYEYLTKSTLIEFIKEILKQKKIQIEKDSLQKKRFRNYSKS
jgi:hypothetical protein